MTVIRVLSLSSDTDRRQTRRRSGYGCIRCGCTICHYCTVSKGKADAFLLCPVCREALERADNADAVIARLLEFPVAGQPELNRADLAFSRGAAIPTVVFPGGVVMEGTPYPILFDRSPVLSLLEPELPGAAFQMTIRVGLQGAAVQTIVDNNEWIAPETDWRFSRLGQTYRISHLSQPVALIFRIFTSETLQIEYLCTWASGRQLVIDGSGIWIDGSPIPVRQSKWELIGLSL